MRTEEGTTPHGEAPASSGASGASSHPGGVAAAADMGTKENVENASTTEEAGDDRASSFLALKALPFFLDRSNDVFVVYSWSREVRPHAPRPFLRPPPAAADAAAQHSS